MRVSSIEVASDRDDIGGCLTAVARETRAHLKQREGIRVLQHEPLPTRSTPIMCDSNSALLDHTWVCNSHCSHDGHVQRVLWVLEECVNELAVETTARCPAFELRWLNRSSRVTLTTDHPCDFVICAECLRDIYEQRVEVVHRPSTPVGEVAQTYITARGCYGYRSSTT